jgi:flagellar motor switch protein FliN/FliY
VPEPAPSPDAAAPSVSAPAVSAPADPAPADPAPAASSAPATATAPAAAAASVSPAPPAAAPEQAPADDPFGGMDQASIDELLRQASFDDPAAAAEAADGASATAVAELPETAAINLPNFSQVMRDAQVSSIDLLRDVDLNVKIELGRSRMQVEDVLKLSEGSVVELDKLAGDPVDVFVNDRLVARGEVLVLNDNFCVRINEIMAGIKEEGL